MRRSHWLIPLSSTIAFTLVILLRGFSNASSDDIVSPAAAISADGDLVSSNSFLYKPFFEIVLQKNDSSIDSSVVVTRGRRQNCDTFCGTVCCQPAPQQVLHAPPPPPLQQTTCICTPGKY